MTKTPNNEILNLLNSTFITQNIDVTPFNLRLISKKVKLKFSEYKISTQLKNMAAAESIAISTKGILFSSETYLEKGTLMRIWIEIPNYWSMKSKYVDYRQTEVPTYFQALARIINCEQSNLKENKHQILCEILNMDPIDESVLQDYLVTSAGVA